MLRVLREKRKHFVDVYPAFVERSKRSDEKRNRVGFVRAKDLDSKTVSVLP